MWDRRSRNFRADGAIPVAAYRRAVVQVPHIGSGVRQYRCPFDGVRYSYDSREGRAMCGALTAIMCGISYATSAEMAAELGAFPGYDQNRDTMLRVMHNHRNAAYGQNDGYEPTRRRPGATRRHDVSRPGPFGSCRSGLDLAVTEGENTGTAMPRPP